MYTEVLVLHYIVISSYWYLYHILGVDDWWNKMETRQLIYRNQKKKHQRP